MQQPGRILIARTDKIGDVICTLPVISNLRKAFPGAHIAYLCREYTKKVLEGNPELNELVIYKPEGEHKGLGGLLKLSDLLESKNYDLVIVLYPRFFIAAAAYLASIPQRIGTAYRWYSFLFNRWVKIHRKRSEKHELEYNLDLLAPLNIEIKEKKIKLWLNDGEKAFAVEFLSKNGLGGKQPVISVHPGAAVSVLNWPLEKYAELIEELHKQDITGVILIEGKGEEGITATIKKKLSFKPAVLPGSADIRQVAAVIGAVNLQISSNTGTMHIAAAMGTPTLTFFNPVTAVNPKRWGPWGNNSTIVMPDVEACRKCAKSCKEYNCMEKIEAGYVVGKAKESLKEGK
jgi:ADP-heptose:LPS heptosyltransferase